VTLTLASLSLGDGVLITDDDLTVAGAFTWENSTLQGLGGHGSLTANGGTALTGLFALNVSNFNLIIAGHAIWSGGPVNFYGASSFTNLAGATFDDQIDGTFGGVHPDCPIFYNQGLFIKSGGNGTTDLAMQLYNSGTVRIDQGTLNVDCGYVQGSGGSISGPVTGSVSNPGTINSGPSPMPAVLTSYTQTVTGTLYEQIGGLTAGTKYGQIIVNGNVNLAGTLQVALINGFTPQNGNQFIIIENQGTNPIGGTFSGLPEGATLLDTTGKYSFTISYIGGEGNDLVLTAKQVATTTTMTASANPAVLNQAVTITATVTPVAGSGTPTGTVQFQIDSTNVGSPVTLTGGSASFSTATLSVGTHTITAVYSGDGNFFASTGNLTETVYSAQQQDTQIINQVNNLVTTGVLSSGNGNALIVKLNSATSSLNAGNTAAGVNQLNAFINQVNAFQKSGQLTSAQAQSLIAAANLAINAANGTGARLLSDTGTSASSGDTQPVTDAGQLVSGTVGVYLDNADGTPVAADEQARFDDAISALDAAFGPYGVNLVDVGATDAADALVQVEMANTSAAGSAADGVLGCTVAGEITLVTGWSWYTGADASAIGAGQYDFETIVMHELGHAVGLGHSGDTGSVMYATLASATARRTLTAADLSVLEASSTTPEPLRAAPTLPPPSETSASVHQEGNGAALVHSPSPAVTFDWSLANALLSSRTTNTQPAEPLARVSVQAVTVPLMTLPAATAIGPNAASESPRARDWNAIPALPQDEPAVRDEEMLDRLYDEAGIDGHWTTAFKDSESALLTQPFVENATLDASVALAVALGGFSAAATTQTKRKRQMAFSPSRR
jgi:hypothetical protein